MALFAYRISVVSECNGHFRVPFTSASKRTMVQTEFYSQVHFHANQLVLKQRQNTTRKWPVAHRIKFMRRLSHVLFLIVAYRRPVWHDFQVS